QITQLRLFLSLIQEIKPDRRQENYGIEPLPNLETKFVCADTLRDFDSRWSFGIESFDIVIGNPPYGADYPAEHKTHFKEHYQSAKTIKGKQKGSLDTFSLFVENAFNQVKQGGWVSFIVPLAFVTSDSMAGLHRILFDNCESIWVSSYADSPAKIFVNVSTANSIIAFTRTNTKCTNLWTTKINRLQNRDGLKDLLDNLQFENGVRLCLDGRIPKISLPIEKQILEKIFTFKTNIGSLLQEDGKPIYYRTSGGRYYNVITNYSTESTKEKPLYFAERFADTIGALLSSDLFWWYYQVYSNIRDQKSYEIESFPIPVDRLTPDITSRIENTYKRYLHDIEKNVRVHQTAAYSKITSFKEYKIRYSKSIIDEIDDIICPLYGLTDEERDFIKSYEIKFRIDE
ncbi:MAG: BREX-1 system adenine-specific DNA-methyltransferase PglX, partial [Planctomycetaceae bacterium]|nr:BREX-1 system adenine-specific DNA-methyltransferase PglX [Planctomycetaceae bacterium]